MNVDQILDREMAKFANPGEHWISSSEDNEGYSVTLYDSGGKYIKDHLIPWSVQSLILPEFMDNIRGRLGFYERERDKLKNLVRDKWGGENKDCL